MGVRRYTALAIVLGAVTVNGAGENLRLIDAVKQGNFTAAKALIAQKSNVNAAEPDGMTALH